MVNYAPAGNLRFETCALELKYKLSVKYLIQAFLSIYIQTYTLEPYLIDFPERNFGQSDVYALVFGIELGVRRVHF